MSATLSTIVKTGGDFITRAASGGSIAIGNTGTLRTITPPPGQRVRLTHLSTEPGAGAQTGISVIFGASTVFDELSIRGDSPASPNNNSVGNYQPYAVGLPPNQNYHQFTGRVDEALVILKNAGNTVSILYYGYEFGL